MNHPALATALGLLALAAVAAAQTPAPEAPHRLVLADSLPFAAEVVRDERIVQGAPYCADAVHETVQTLADGNRIVHRQSSRLCRDAQGRTRQEVERGGRKVVYLRDPVAQEHWRLDPDRRTARRLHAAGPEIEIEGLFDRNAWRDYGERMREWARGVSERVMRGADLAPPAPPAPPSPPTPPVPPRPSAVVVQPMAPGTDREVEVRVLRFDGPGAAPAMAPPAVRWSAQTLAPRGRGVTTVLPPREVEGLSAHGERTTWTIEAGRIGNEKPIEIVREVWTAPALALTVLSRDLDPRSGEVSYRLANLKRGEPDAALMRVPDDYKKN